MGTRKKGQQQVKTNKTEILLHLGLHITLLFLKCFNIISVWKEIILASLDKISAMILYCYGTGSFQFLRKAPEGTMYDFHASTYTLKF